MNHRDTETQSKLRKLLTMLGIIVFLLSSASHFASAQTIIASLGVKRTTSHWTDSDGVVFLFTKGQAQAVDARSGQIKWAHKVGEGMFVYPVRLDKSERRVGEPLKEQRSLVFINSMLDNTLFALYEDNGEEKWRFTSDGPLPAAPSVSTGMVYVTSSVYDSKPSVRQDGNVYALDTEDGTQKWVYSDKINAMVSPVLGVTNVGDAEDKYLYIVCQGEIKALDNKTGDLQRRIKIDGLLETSPLALGPYPIVCVNVAPEQCEIRNYRVDNDKTEIDNPQQTFTLEGEITNAPLLYGGYIFAVTNHGWMAVFRANLTNRSEGIVPVIEDENLRPKWIKIPFDAMTFMAFGERPDTIIVGRDSVYGYKIYFRIEDAVQQTWGFFDSTGGSHYPELLKGTIMMPIQRVGKALYVNTTDVGANKDYLYAIDSSNGNTHWKIETGIGVEGEPVLSGDNRRLYLPANDNSIYVVDLPPTDTPDRAAQKFYVAEVAKTSGSGQFPIKVVAWKDKLYFGGHNETFYAIDQNDGSLLWDVLTQGRVLAPARLYKDILYFGSSITVGQASSLPRQRDAHATVGNGGAVYAISAATGDWKYFEYSPEDSRGFSTTPFVTEDTVYIGSNDGCLYALEKIDYLGEGNEHFGLKWKFPTGAPIKSSPIFDAGIIYFGSDDGHVYALLDEKTSGTLIWKFSTGAPVRSAPKIENGIVFISSANGVLYALKDGIKLWEVETRGKIQAQPTIDAPNQKIYVGSTDAHLYEIDIATGEFRSLFKATSSITATAALNKDGSKLYIACTSGDVYEYQIGEPAEESVLEMEGEIKWSGD